MLPDSLSLSLASLGLDVSPKTLPRLICFLEELLRWNKSINLTAVRDLQEGAEKHLVDSLTPLFILGGHERVIDIGSGGGLPGIPLKLARPDLEVVSVETVGKKATFQRHIVRLLGLSGFHVLPSRIEDLQRQEGMAAAFDVVISRAFSSLEHFIPLGAPFLAPGGRLVAMKGPEGENELRDATVALQVAGLECQEVRCLELPRSKARRTLIVMTRP